jgi:hypothetical protein
VTASLRRPGDGVVGRLVGPPPEGPPVETMIADRASGRADRQR